MNFKKFIDELIEKNGNVHDHIMRSPEAKSMIFSKNRVDYDDTGDMKYVLQHLKDYKYDGNKDLNANMAAALKNRCCETTSKKVYSIDKSNNIEYFDSIRDAERATGFSHSNIVRALKGRRPSCGGRKWFYQE